jgi:uncharacterized lipoprotein YajG
MKTTSFLTLVMLMFALLALAGCATTDQRVNFLYAPSNYASGGYGDLYVVEPAGSTAKETTNQWILGKIIDSNGKQTGNIISPVRPDDLVANAFSAELKAAGYNAMASVKSPSNATRIVLLNSLNLEMKEVASYVKAEVNCSLKISLGLMKNGKLIKTLDYEAGNKNTVVTDKATLIDDILRTTLKDIMKQAVPEIVRSFESPA